MSHPRDYSSSLCPISAPLSPNFETVNLSVDKTRPVRSGLENVQNPSGLVWSRDEISRATSLRILHSVLFGVGEKYRRKIFNVGIPAYISDLTGKQLG